MIALYVWCGWVLAYVGPLAFSLTDPCFVK
jgi:hypothetical protein